MFVSTRDFARQSAQQSRRLGGAAREPSAKADESTHRWRHEESELDQAEKATDNPSSSDFMAGHVRHPGHETDSREGDEDPPREPRTSQQQPEQEQINADATGAVSCARGQNAASSTYGPGPRIRPISDRRKPNRSTC